MFIHTFKFAEGDFLSIEPRKHPDGRSDFWAIKNGDFSARSNIAPLILWGEGRSPEMPPAWVLQFSRARTWKLGPSKLFIGCEIHVKYRELPKAAGRNLLDVIWIDADRPTKDALVWLDAQIYAIRSFEA